MQAHDGVSWVTPSARVRGGFDGKPAFGDGERAGCDGSRLRSHVGTWLEQPGKGFR
jgi:hypothetical protein